MENIEKDIEYWKKETYCRKEAKECVNDIENAICAKDANSRTISAIKEISQIDFSESVEYREFMEKVFKNIRTASALGDSSVSFEIAYNKDDKSVFRFVIETLRKLGYNVVYSFTDMFDMKVEW